MTQTILSPITHFQRHPRPLIRNECFIELLLLLIGEQFHYGLRGVDAEVTGVSFTRDDGAYASLSRASRTASCQTEPSPKCVSTSVTPAASSTREHAAAATLDAKAEDDTELVKPIPEHKESSKSSTLISTPPPKQPMTQSLNVSIWFGCKDRTLTEDAARSIYDYYTKKSEFLAESSKKFNFRSFEKLIQRSSARNAKLRQHGRSSTPQYR